MTSPSFAREISFFDSKSQSGANNENILDSKGAKKSRKLFKLSGFLP